jgi:hypothetical protein
MTQGTLTNNADQQLDDMFESYQIKGVTLTRGAPVNY